MFARCLLVAAILVQGAAIAAPSQQERLKHLEWLWKEVNECHELKDNFAELSAGDCDWKRLYEIDDNAKLKFCRKAFDIYMEKMGYEVRGFTCRL